MSSLGDFSAADLDEETKQECVQQIEHAMQKYCEDCETNTTDNLGDMCEKHLRMYGKYYP